MRKLFWILIIIFPLSCSRKPKLPKDILPQPKMQAVVWDLMLAGEFLNGYVLFRDSSPDAAAISKQWYDKVYQVHHITEAQFRKSYDYYTQHPKIMRELLDSLAKKPSPAPVPERYGQHAPKPDSTRAAEILLRKQQASMDSIMRKAENYKRRTRKPLKRLPPPREVE